MVPDEVLFLQTGVTQSARVGCQSARVGWGGEEEEGRGRHLVDRLAYRRQIPTHLTAVFTDTPCPIEIAITGIQFTTLATLQTEVLSISKGVGHGCSEISVVFAFLHPKASAH